MSRRVVLPLLLLPALACHDTPVQPPPHSPNHRPVANIGGPYIGYEGSNTEFRGTATDTDGDSLSGAWVFGDGTTATGFAVRHRYLDACLCTVRFIVTDSHQATDTATLVVNVANQPPLVNQIILSRTTVAVGTPVSVRVVTITDAFDTNTTVVDWGDGEKSVSPHSYGHAGLYSLA